MYNKLECEGLIPNMNEQYVEVGQQKENRVKIVFSLRNTTIMISGL